LASIDAADLRKSALEPRGSKGAKWGPKGASAALQPALTFPGLPPGQTRERDALRLPLAFLLGQSGRLVSRTSGLSYESLEVIGNARAGLDLVGA
jgi:hypothetical protein